MERRTELRIKRSFACAIYTKTGDFPGKILDVSKDGLAFVAASGMDIEVSDLITVSLHDTYLNEIKEPRLFFENVNASIRDMIILEDGRCRYGCYINNRDYQKYLQELYMAYSCGAEGKSKDLSA